MFVFWSRSCEDAKAPVPSAAAMHGAFATLCVLLRGTE